MNRARAGTDPATGTRVEGDIGRADAATHPRRKASDPEQDDSESRRIVRQR
jgi:hypothetical protein